MFKMRPLIEKLQFVVTGDKNGTIRARRMPCPLRDGRDGLGASRQRNDRGTARSSRKAGT
jgi:hypothetical protein